jgi:hypothetical protein
VVAMKRKRPGPVWVIYLVAGLLVASLAFDFVELDKMPNGVFVTVALAIILAVLLWRRRA